MARIHLGAATPPVPRTCLRWWHSSEAEEQPNALIVRPTPAVLSHCARLRLTLPGAFEIPVLLDVVPPRHVSVLPRPGAELPGPPPPAGGLPLRLFVEPLLPPPVDALPLRRASLLRPHGAG